jgi:hypothetical protein
MHSNNARRCRWRTALAAGQRLGSRAPAARSARTLAANSTCHTRGTRVPNLSARPLDILKWTVLVLKQEDFIRETVPASWRYFRPVSHEV